jgi:hypothetical protein
VSASDVLSVPADVRANLKDLLPATQFAVYSLAPSHCVALTTDDDHPYEAYLPYSTARNRSGDLECMISTRTSHAALVRVLPPGSDADLPICRDVWHYQRGVPRKLFAVDIVYPHGPTITRSAMPSMPMVVNILRYDQSDVMKGTFDTPIGGELGLVVAEDPLGQPRVRSVPCPGGP